MRSIQRSIGLLVAAATVASTVALARPAAAAEPTRIKETSTAVQVAAGNGERRVEVRVQRSDQSGAYASADLYGGPAGDVLGRGAQGITEWTDTTFRAEVELFDEAERPVGAVSVAGTYAITGAAQRQEEKYNDGNVHVVIDNTWTPVSVSDVTVSFDGQAWPVVGTEGWHMTGYLFVSNPATYVGSAEQVVITNWSGDNVIDFHTDNEHSSLREALLFLEYIDNPYVADGVIDLSKRAWEGTFELSDKSGGSLGRMPATATIAAGDPMRFTDRVRGGYERWTITPYDLQLTVDGPLAPAKVTAHLVRIQVAWHTSPQGGSEG